MCLVKENVFWSHVIYSSICIWLKKILFNYTNSTSVKHFHFVVKTWADYYMVWNFCVLRLSVRNRHSPHTFLLKRRRSAAVKRDDVLRRGTTSERPHLISCLPIAQRNRSDTGFRVLCVWRVIFFYRYSGRNSIQSYHYKWFSSWQYFIYL